MKWLELMLGLAFFAAITVGSWHASVTGWGLPGALAKPVSVRQQSVTGHGRAGPHFFYFGGTHRRHFSGGYQGGK
jgi:hypothetical protein